MSVSKITTEELVAMFGPRIPMDAIALLQTAPDDVGLDRIRELLLEIKEARDREEGTAAVTVPQEVRDELRRLQRALDSETGNRINLGQRLSVANKRIDQLMAANSAAEVKLSQAKDALAAAEAERDLLRGMDETDSSLPNGLDDPAKVWRLVAKARRQRDAAWDENERLESRIDACSAELRAMRKRAENAERVIEVINESIASLGDGE